MLSELRSCHFDHPCSRRLSELLQREVSQPQRSMAPGRHPRLTRRQEAPLCFAGTCQRGWGQAWLCRTCRAACSAHLPVLHWRALQCGPQEQWFWEGHGHCMILGGFDSSAGTSNSTRAPCHDHSPQLSPGPLPQEHRAAPTQQAYSKEDTLPTATFILLEFTRYKELDLHATCHRLGLLCPSVCHVGREEGGWQRQAPPDWCPHCSQGFPCSLCDRHHFCCDGFALPARSKHYGRGKSPMGQELGPLS